MSKSGKLKTKASSEPARFWDDGVAGSSDGVVQRKPGMEGNDFDVRMREEPDGIAAAKTIAGHIKRSGICLVEANAPPDLLVAACEEADALWEDGEFSPPFRVSDDRSMMEAKLWQQAMRDDEKVIWFNRDGPTSSDVKGSMNALKLLAGNIADFAGGLAASLEQEKCVKFDRVGHVMLSCYTGDRVYNLHVDNSHGNDDEDAQVFPDNGMRLSAIYFLNTHWHPYDNEDCAGGLDVCLTDSNSLPAGSAEAKLAPKFRIAPHADTLALFLSERMAHQVIKTRGDSKWFCMTLWTMHGATMDQMPRKLVELRKRQEREDNSEEDD